MYDTITFLTDFGLQDDFVGVCKGVMKRIARNTLVIDVTHGIAPQAVRQGALVLARAVPYLPAGVHLAVVDPGVGSERRGVAVRTREDRVYVGPDNGLLMLAAERFGGAARAVDLSHSRERARGVSRTFHGRDVFAPVAPTPGSTTARCTPAGMNGSAAASASAPARTSQGGTPWVMSITRAPGQRRAITPWHTPTNSSCKP